MASWVSPRCRGDSSSCRSSDGQPSSMSDKSWWHVPLRGEDYMHLYQCGGAMLFISCDSWSALRLLRFVAGGSVLLCCSLSSAVDLLVFLALLL